MTLCFVFDYRVIGILKAKTVPRAGDVVYLKHTTPGIMDAYKVLSVSWEFCLYDNKNTEVRVYLGKE